MGPTSCDREGWHLFSQACDVAAGADFTLVTVPLSEWANPSDPMHEGERILWRDGTARGAPEGDSVSLTVLRRRHGNPSAKDHTMFPPENASETFLAAINIKIAERAAEQAKARLADLCGTVKAALAGHPCQQLVNLADDFERRAERALTDHIQKQMADQMASLLALAGQAVTPTSLDALLALQKAKQTPAA